MIAEGSLEVVGKDVFTASALLRKLYWGEYRYNGQCIVSRDIVSLEQVKCSEWREIETELSFCRCIKPAAESAAYCQEWQCEEKDVGEFSILFSQPRSYEGEVEGMEVETYKCKTPLLLAS